jgi:FkbM family methyltransferase
MRLPFWARRWTSIPIRNIPITIRRGPNRGRKWSLAVSGRGIVTGGFEVERFEAVASLIRPDEVFWDVGAHYGYATLIAASTVVSSGSVTSFEPSSSNRGYLRRHLRWNGESGVRVMDCAVGDSDRTDRIGGTGSSLSFHLGGAGESVQVRSISSLVDEGLPFPTFIKVDAEGSEAIVLEGAGPALDEARGRDALPTMLVSVHDERLYRQCLEFLQTAGYTVLVSTRISLFEAGGENWKGDPDLLAIPPQREGDLPTLRSIPWFSAAPGA